MTDPRPDDRARELAELLAEVRRIDVQASRLVTSMMAGGYSSAFRGSGIEFEGVREYVEGDDPRTVDWNVTARMGRPFVKTYVEERELTVLFVLDLSASMASGLGGFSPRGAAARIAACLALTAIRNNDKVGLVAFSAGVDRFVPPKKGMPHVLRIIRDCLALPGASRRTALGPALDFTSRVTRRGAVLFVLSDFFAEDWRRPLLLAARRHDVVAVRLLGPESTGDPAFGRGAGLVRVRDPESGRSLVLDFDSRRVREAWAGRMAARRAETAEAIARAGADLMDVEIPRAASIEAISRPILRFFRMREARSAKR